MNDTDKSVISFAGFVLSVQRYRQQQVKGLEPVPQIYLNS